MKFTILVISALVTTWGAKGALILKQQVETTRTVNSTTIMTTTAAELKDITFQNDQIIRFQTSEPRLHPLILYQTYTNEVNPGFDGNGSWTSKILAYKFNKYDTAGPITTVTEFFLAKIGAPPKEDLIPFVNGWVAGETTKDEQRMGLFLPGSGANLTELETRYTRVVGFTRPALA